MLQILQAESRSSRPNIAEGVHDVLNELPGAFRAHNQNIPILILNNPFPNEAGVSGAEVCGSDGGRADVTAETETGSAAGSA